MRLNRLFAGTAIALSLALASCGGGGVEDDTLTLRRGISAKVDTLDPHRNPASWEYIVLGAMFLSLTQLTADAQLIPATSHSWPVRAGGHA